MTLSDFIITSSIAVSNSKLNHSEYFDLASTAVDSLSYTMFSVFAIVVAYSFGGLGSFSLIDHLFDLIASGCRWWLYPA